MKIEEDKERFSYKKALKISKNSEGMNFLKYIDLYLNRPMASLIVRAVFNTRITPNMITYFSSFLGILGAFFFSRGEYLYFILGGLFAQLSSIVDGADGMLARAKNKTSAYGTYLDLFFDRIIDFSTAIGVGIGAAKYYNNQNLLFLAVLSGGLLLLQVNIFYITKSYLNQKQTGDTGEMRAVQIWGILIFSCLNKLDILIYVSLFATSLVNIAHIYYFLKLGWKKDRLFNTGFEKTQQSESSKQQCNNTSDQNKR